MQNAARARYWHVAREAGRLVGTYGDDIRGFEIEVAVEEGTLYWALQGLESEELQPEHYERDGFAWIRTRDELARRGRWVDRGVPFWTVEFKGDDKGQIDRFLPPGRKRVFRDEGMGPV